MRAFAGAGPVAGQRDFGPNALAAAGLAAERGLAGQRDSGIKRAAPRMGRRRAAG